ncbi:MAG: penicillin acylase family protein [Pseudomonadota bacterium]
MLRLLILVLRRVLFWSFVGLLLALTVSYYFLSRSLPVYNAERRVAELRAETEIVRDARAVPHIFAQTEFDAFFALGYVHAQDRLWQMELNRRIAKGQLSSLFQRFSGWAGRREDLLRLDETMHALNLHGLSVASLEGFSPGVRRQLDAYAAGVNARLDVINAEALGRGTPELLILGGTVERWTAADSVMAMKFLAASLSSAVFADLRRARFQVKLGPELVTDLFPEVSDEPVMTLPPFEAAGLPVGPMVAERLAGLSDWPFSPDAADLKGASNAWAVSAERSSSRAPLLATDPHLPLTAPSIWYMARLDWPSGAAIGATVPGIPAVLVGRNAALGWGATALDADTQDLFIERLNPDNPEEYATEDGWEPFEMRTASIRTGEGEAVEVVLRETRRGPVLPLGWRALAEVTPDGHVPVLSWTVLTAEDRTLEAAMRLMSAATVEEAMALRRLVVAPAQVSVFADGVSIAMATAGHVPLRRADNPLRGRAPMPGWKTENAWQGMTPVSQLPASLNPASGAVANANNRITDAPFPNHIGHDWPPSYRIERIEKLLNGRAFHSLGGFQTIQNDSVSEMARTVLPLIATPLWAKAEGEAGLRRQALDALAQWNGDMDPFLAEPLIFSSWLRALTHRLVEGRLDALENSYRGPRPLFVARVFRNTDGAAFRWCTDEAGTAPPDCRSLASEALDRALAELSDRFGTDMTSWRWGRAHIAHHAHQPFSESPLGILSDIRHESGGGRHTIYRGDFTGRGKRPYTNVHAGGFRAVYDFADLDRSVYAMATGQSGHMLSRHYDDFAEEWRSGEYAPLSLDRQDAEAGSVGVTRLLPVLRDPLLGDPLLGGN